jgi:hypothetical protein
MALLPGQLARQDNSCFQPVLRKVLRIECQDEVGFALLGAKAEWIVPWVGGNLDGATNLDLVGPIPDEVHESSD